MKLDSHSAGDFAWLVYLNQQLGTAKSLLAELPADSSDRPHIYEWLAETLSALRQIEQHMAASRVRSESADSFHLRHDNLALVESHSIAELSKRLLESQLPTLAESLNSTHSENEGHRGDTV
jgi:hypothetical protein